jgi:hypothetical protein
MIIISMALLKVAYGAVTIVNIHVIQNSVAETCTYVNIEYEVLIE